MPIAIIPDIDEQRCIDCALCVEICTSLGPIKTTENPDGTLAPETPEIKANNADLDLKRDTDIGMSDLKKP